LKSCLNNAPHVLPEKGIEGLFLHVPVNSLGSNGVDQWGRPFAFRDTHDVLVQDLLDPRERKRERGRSEVVQTICGNERCGGV
jgi:hypothetical protein